MERCMQCSIVCLAVRFALCPLFACHAMSFSVSPIFIYTKNLLYMFLSLSLLHCLSPTYPSRLC